MDKSKIIRLISSVVISIFLWVFVIYEVNPETTKTIKNVPVTLIGIETLHANKLAIEGNGEYTVDITVRSTRTEMFTITKDSFVVTANVEDLSLGQDYLNVNVKAPIGSTVDEIKQKKIPVYVAELVTKTVPVEIKYNAASSGYETTIYNISNKTVEVSGAKALVEKVSKYYVSLEDEKLEIDEANSFTLKGIISDSDGNLVEGLSCSIDSISCDAVIYQTKTVNLLKPEVTGSVWKGAIQNKIEYPLTLDIKGPSKLLDEITELSAKTVSIDGVFEDISIPLNIKLPEGIVLCEKNSNPSLNVDIADDGRYDIVLDCSSIAIKNYDSKIKISYVNNDTITLTATGPVTLLKNLKASDFEVAIDIDGLGIGIHELELLFTSYAEGVSFSIDPTNIVISIKR